MKSQTIPILIVLIILAFISFILMANYLFDRGKLEGLCQAACHSSDTLISNDRVLCVCRSNEVVYRGDALEKLKQ